MKTGDSNSSSSEPAAVSEVAIGHTVEAGGVEPTGTMTDDGAAAPAAASAAQTSNGVNGGEEESAENTKREGKGQQDAISISSTDSGFESGHDQEDTSTQVAPENNRKTDPATSKDNIEEESTSSSPKEFSDEVGGDVQQHDQEDTQVAPENNRKTDPATSKDNIEGESTSPSPRGFSDEAGGDGEQQQQQQQKSPVSSDISPRRRVTKKAPTYNDDSFSSFESDSVSDDESDGSEEEKLKIDRIIASRKETIRTWREIGEKTNTTEIENGSRWFQEDSALNDDDVEERFLVKWKDLSFLHCSWETEMDLMAQLERPKPYFAVFNRKNIDGLVFDEDERGDGEYFDENMMKVERILKITLPSETDGAGGTKDGVNADESESDKVPASRFGVILDREDPVYEKGTGRQFLVKWVNAPYSDCTYEFERDLILNEVEYEEQVDAFLRRSKKPTKDEVENGFKKREEQKRQLYKFFGDKAVLASQSKETFVKEYKKRLEEQEFGKDGGKLRDYQAEGVSWLISNYVNNRSSILSDEMGLGKTVQVASFLNILSTESSIRGPFLVVVPLSTIAHWRREFSNWTDLNSVVYHGTAEDRAFIREHEMAFESDRPSTGTSQGNYLRKCLPSKSKGPRAAAKWQRTWMAQVVITTPEMLVTEDFAELTAIDWGVLVIDEAHRMKNHESKVASNMREGKFSFGHKVLMTGTPIQNNMQELWTILHMIDPEHFDDSNSFLEKYGDMKNKEIIDELHSKIRPYMLRRLKEDVETSVPPKEETVIEVELTVLQKQYYRALYEKNVQFLHKGRKKAFDKPSLANLGMQLRKCCNHPFLLNGAEKELRKTDPNSAKSEGDFLVKASGKLVLLDKLLPKLKKDGHRVLVFSQFKIMLDILEDFFRHREMKYERIDGSITGRKRQMAIDRFQADTTSDGKEQPFVMMLSTRAGGVGINLTKADTCIIFDSDWNPQNDLQAQSRCHRIGQTKSVEVYRLISRKSFEMKMFHMSSLKLGLDQAVLQGLESGSSGGDTAMTKDEVEKLLRHGAYDIFNEEKTGSSERESSLFEAQSIDDILARRTKTVVYQNTGSKSNAAGSTFSKASFTAVHDDADRKGNVDDVDIEDPDFWKKVVGEGKVEEASAVDLSGKKRKRNAARYSHFFTDAGAAVNAGSDSDSSADIGDSPNASDDDNLAEDGSIDLTDLTNEGKRATDAASSGPIGPKVKPATKIPRRNQSAAKYVEIRGIQIPYNHRSSIKLLKSGQKILVLRSLKDLLVGDEIVGINGVDVRQSADKGVLEKAILNSPNGRPVSLDIIRPILTDRGVAVRSNSKSNIPVPLAAVGSRPNQPQTPVNIGHTSSDPHKPLTGLEGLDIVEVTLIRDRLHHPKFGMSVASNGGKHIIDVIEKGSAAAAARTLRTGDELLVVNDKLAVGVDWREVFREIKTNEMGQPLRLRVLRRPSHHSPYGVGAGGIGYQYGEFKRNIPIHRHVGNTFGIDMKFVRDSVAVVAQIQSDTPAERAGILRVNDEIVSVNGKPLTGLGWSFSQIMGEMRATKAGCALFLDVFRPLHQPLGEEEEPARTPPTERARDAERPLSPTRRESDLSSEVRASDDVSAAQTMASERNNDDALVDRGINGKLIKGIEIPRQGAARFGMQLGVTNSLAYVQSIVDKSPISLEGTVQVADYIVKVNGQSMMTSDRKLIDVIAAMKATKRNQSLFIDILRPAEKRDESGNISTLIKGISIPRRSGEMSFGVILRRCETRSIGDLVGFRKAVYVNGIIPHSAADREGSVQHLDVILSVNGVDLTNADHTFQDALGIIRSTETGQPLVLDILRPTENEMLIHLQNSKVPRNGTEEVAGDESNSSEKVALEGPNPAVVALSQKVGSEARNNIVRSITIERGELKSLGLRFSSVDGKAVISEIATDGPAGKEGSLRVGDEVIAVNGKSVIDPALEFNDILLLCFSAKAGEPLVLDVSRASTTANSQVLHEARTETPQEVPPPTVLPPQAAIDPDSPPKLNSVPASSVQHNRSAGQPIDVETQGSNAQAETSGKDLQIERMAENMAVASGDEANAESVAKESRNSPQTAAGPAEGGTDSPVGATSCDEGVPRAPIASAGGGLLLVVEKEDSNGQKDGSREKKAPPSNGDSLQRSNDPKDESAPPAKPKASPSKLKASPSKRKASPSKRKASPSKRKKVCFVATCEKGPQYGTEGMCLRHWHEHAMEKAESNGREYLNRRVAKHFVDGIYYGCVSSYNMSASEGEEEAGAFWHIDYDDGDAEDYDITDLCQALLLYNRNKKSDNNNNNNKAGSS